MKAVIITGSRADWSGLGMVAKRLAGKCEVEVIATGQHSSTGSRDIRADFPGLIREVDIRAAGSSGVAVAGSAGLAVERVARALDASKPDLAILAGDRYEILASAVACSIMGVPIAHIAGGDETRGSTDDAYRKAITAMASIHFVSNVDAYNSVLRGARAGALIFTTGSPAIDRIKATSIFPAAGLFQHLGLKRRKINVLVAFHPATQALHPLHELDELLSALKALDAEASFLVLGSNADPGADEVTRRLVVFARSCSSACFMDHIQPSHYLSVLSHFDLMVGNSSAGFYEAPSFGIPVVNVGIRQKGRVAALNIRTVPAERGAIARTINIAIRGGRMANCQNPNGDGTAADKIGSILLDLRYGKVSA